MSKIRAGRVERSERQEILNESIGSYELHVTNSGINVVLSLSLNGSINGGINNIINGGMNSCTNGGMNGSIFDDRIESNIRSIK